MHREDLQQQPSRSREQIQDIDESLKRLKKISSISGAGGEGSGSFTNVGIDRIKDLFSQITSKIEKAYQLSWKTTGTEVGAQVQVNIKVHYSGAKGLFKTQVEKDYILRESPTKQRVD